MQGIRPKNPQWQRGEVMTGFLEQLCIAKLTHSL